MSRRHSIYFPLLLVSILLASCATPQKVVKEYIETIQIDTITVHDTIPVIVHIEPDSAKVASDSIPATQAKADEVKSGKLNIAPWYAFTKNSYAKAWISNNAPYLEIKNFERDIAVNTPITFNKYNTTREKSQKETVTETIEVALPWYKDNWFYITVILSMLLIFIFILWLRKFNVFSIIKSFLGGLAKRIVNIFKVK